MKPWKILSSTYPRPRIRMDDCELPNGHRLEATVLEFRRWANIVALTPNQEVVMVRQYRHGAAQDFLEFPGGIVEDGEDPQSGAARELLEESGYRAAEIFETGRLYPNPALQTNQLFCYLATGAKKAAQQNLDAGEDIEVELVPLEKLLGMAKEGKLRHALNIAVFFQALLHLNRIG